MADPFPLPERPKLRPVEAFPVRHDGEQAVALRDPYGFAERVVLLPPPVFLLATTFDGERDILAIQAEWARRTGELVFREQIEAIVRALDEALFLEGPRFREHRRRAVERFRAANVREPAHAGGAYPAEARALSAFLDEIGGAAPAAIELPAGPRLLGLVAPHIDPRRGAAAYARAYEAVERAGGADLYVIFGTAHQGALRYGADSGIAPPGPRSLAEHVEDLFIFTKKSFRTPLGLAETDRAFIERLEARLGRPLDRAELSHRSEHSVEFQVVYLQRVEERLARGEGRPPRPVRIVPLLCNSLQPWTQTGASPAEVPEVARALGALREAIAEERAAGRRVLPIAGADLAHIGLKFGDERPADEARCKECEEIDRASLAPVLRGDGEGWFSFVAAEKDRRNICGVSCMYAVLKTLAEEPREGTLLAYGQAREPEAGSMVSFCAVGLYS